MPASPSTTVTGVPGDVVRFQAPAGAGAWEALRACARAHPGRDIVLLAHDTQLPDAWWPRLCAARALDYDAIFPLSNAIPALDPFHGLERPARIDDADACVYMLSEREPIPSRDWLPACCLWRGAALSDLPENPQDGPLPPGLQAAALDSLYVAAPSTRPGTLPPPAAIDALRERIRALKGRIPIAAGRDARPVLLHVLHGWGGGVQHFVETLMASSGQYRHLALVAHGSSERRRPGEALALHDDLRAPPLATWPLALGIESTALASNEYDAALTRVLRRFRVAQVMASSLIGHGLAALRTGLPTAVVCHDYYPLWPHLHVDFGDESTDFSPQALDAALRDSAQTPPFAETRAPVWRRLREDYVAALLAARATLFFPSRTVQRNLQRIEPRLAPLPSHVIPHGIPAWPEPVVPVVPPARDTLRVLVLGRINGGKGEDLLARLIPKLDPRIELLLLGAGRAGMRFFGASRVHLCMDYRREELPGLIRQFAPDAALVPVTVAETFSYTLSELWSLGVPVLATHLGSLAERIREGENGLLVAPDPDAVAARLAALLDDRSALEALRRVHPQPAPDAMARAYERALALPATPPWPALPAGDPIGANVRNTLEQAHIHISGQLAHMQRLVAEQRAEMERRADWGDSLQNQLDERTGWARSLEETLGTTRERLASLNREFEERSRWALSLNEALQAMTQNWNHDHAALEQSRGELEQSQAELERHRAAVEQNQAELAKQRSEIADLTAWLHAAVKHGDDMQRDRDEILASRSWRLTRPLRYAHRLATAFIARLRFRWQRLVSLQRRMHLSLRTRGLRGTLGRMRQALRPAAPAATPIALPLPDAVDATRLVLPSSDTPVASIVIPVYNHLDATLVCLRSLAQTKNRTPHEIIVVDDCSSDDSPTVLPTVRGLRYQRNPQNTGFIGACNAGAANARGQFVVFLNNDTAVQDGWLDALIDTFAQHRDVGLVGAKLVYPDGRLQEAGGIVFSDGSGWNYGRFDDPAKPEYTFVREVDYCSGAAIALRTDLFRHFGGFDPHYAPAYYEDTDLAMKVRQAGLRVLYQPASVVVHFEGVSSGTDTSSGTKRYQVINQEKFLARWKETLTSHAAPGTDIVIARQHRAKKHVLIIDATTPQPDHDSGSVRLCNIFRLLLEDGCAVTFFADNRAFVERYSSALQQMGVEVLWHPHLSDPVSWFARNGKRFDLILVARHYIASGYVELVRTHAPKARLAFDTVDLHYLREQRAAELAGSAELARTAEKTREQELTLIRTCDVTLVVSPVEQELLAREAPGARVDILSNVHEVFGRRRGFSERADIMFVGGYQHPPNIDAAVWFATDILPLVRKELPELRFHLIGSKAPAEVRALGELPGVVFHGFVEDIEPFLDGCRLAVAPLRYGAGVKGKVNMSMSYGQPVVATGIAVEGMFAEPGRDVLTAETPEDFAAQVIRAYRDEVLWTQLSDNGVANVSRHFSFDAARQALRGLLER